MNNFLSTIQNKKFSRKKGFAMLFTVLIITLILSIAISISNLTLKQTLLSSLAKDSQISFYQADAAVECGLYYDITLGQFPLDVDPVASITCGNDTYSSNALESAQNYFVYTQDIADTTKPCATLFFDKATTPGINSVLARGYNVCAASPRQVERALEVQY